MTASIRQLFFGSIGKQLAWGGTLTVALVMTVFIISMIDREKTFLHRQSLESTQSLAQSLAVNSVHQVLTNDLAGLNELIAPLTKYPGFGYAMIIDPEGKVISHSSPHNEGLYLQDTVSRSLLSGPPAVRVLADDDMLDIAAPIQAGSSVVGWARIGIGQERIAENIRSIVLSGVLYTLLAVAAGSLVAAVVAHRITSGLRKVVSVSEATASGKRDSRASMEREDEVGRLGAAVDQMIDALLLRESSIQEKTEELDRFFSLALDLLCIADTSGHFVRLNLAWEETLGYSPEELRGRRFFDLIHPDDIASTSETVSRLAQGEKIVNFVNRYRHKNGTYRWIEWRSVAYQKTIIYAAARDVTEQREYELRLTHANRLYAVLSEVNRSIISATDRNHLFADVCRIATEKGGFKLAWIGIVDPESGWIKPAAQSGDHDGYISEINLSACDIPEGQGPTGLAIRSGSGSVCNELTENSSMALWMEKALKRGYRACSAFPLRQGGAIIGAFILYSGEASFFSTEEITLLTEISDDISYALDTIAGKQAQKASEQERQRLEDQLLQAQKLESVGRLAGGVAHDYNNMLAVTLINLELLKRQIDPDSPQRELLNEIEKASLRSRDITRQLLAFSRKQVIEPVLIDLNKAIEQTLKALSHLIGEDIQIRFIPQSELWTIRMDPSQFDQILVNLAVNARDAMPDGGMLTIETTTVRLDSGFCLKHAEFKPGDYVMLAVTDNGVGMTTETLSHIFEPFFTTKEIGKGTGLGLATVFGIVKQHEGYVDVYSEPDRGTMFKLYFPRADEEDAPARKMSQQVRSGKKGTILLVEDDVLLRKSITSMLKALEHNVLVADNPLSALSLLNEYSHSIDLLLTDVVMPGMNGKELQLKAEELRPGIRTLFMSGYTANVIAHRGVLDKGVHFIQKPFASNSLNEKISEILID